jgi:type VI secretion system secreted protein VgrG
VRTLLREGGVDDAQVSVDVARTPPVRPYCVQYDESDWAFAERLLEDEGIHYAFTHDADRWTLVLRDRSPDATAATPASLGFVHDAPAEALDEVAWSGALTTRVAEAAARVDGYDPTRPSLVLGADARAEGQAGRRCYEWPAPHREPRESQQTARVRLDALRAERETLTVETHAVTVTPGTRLQVLDHPSPIPAGDGAATLGASPRRSRREAAATTAESRRSPAAPSPHSAASSGPFRSPPG